MGYIYENVEHYLRVDEFYDQVKEKSLQEYEQYALVSLDFDNFNFINDLFGFEVGDQVLYRLVEYFSSVLHEKELFTKVHADCFVFFVEIFSGEQLIERFKEIGAIKETMRGILPLHYHLVCSGGMIAVRNGEAIQLNSLLDKANYARKKAKGNHNNAFLFYDEKMEQEIQWKKLVTTMMENAVVEKEFKMYLQPKVLMKTEQVVGAEALARWNSPTYGMIYPDQFIPILEQNGFIKELDFFILNEACQFLNTCINQQLPVVPISVNFSKLHIQDEDFVEKLNAIVKNSRIPTSLIEIEFTEYVIDIDFQSLIKIANQLKALGYKISLDDFGAKYSSLSYLKDVPVDIVKIDKAFLDATSNTQKGRLIIAKMVELIKSLHLVAVMEGVETQEQISFLNQLDCDLGQGYFYAKPMPIKDFEAFVDEKEVINYISV